jgi:hypothetical protein
LLRKRHHLFVNHPEHPVSIISYNSLYELIHNQLIQTIQLELRKFGRVCSSDLVLLMRPESPSCTALCSQHVPVCSSQCESHPPCSGSSHRQQRGHRIGQKLRWQLDEVRSSRPVPQVAQIKLDSTPILRSRAPSNKQSVLLVSTAENT